MLRTSKGCYLHMLGAFKGCYLHMLGTSKGCYLLMLETSKGCYLLCWGLLKVVIYLCWWLLKVVIYFSKIYLLREISLALCNICNMNAIFPFDLFMIYDLYTKMIWFWFLVFNPTFSNSSPISWRLVLVAEEAGVPGENHRPRASN